MSISRFFARNGVLLVLAAVSVYGAICAGAKEILTKPAELPRTFLTTAPPVQSGTVRTVAANCSDLQHQIDAAQAGDTVQIPAGTTCTGNFVLPKKPASASWIVIRTATPDSMLPPGVRVNPQTAGKLARILTPKPLAAIRTDPGAHHYRLIGLEIGLIPNFNAVFNYGIVLFGDSSEAQKSMASVPSDLVLDRCYVHGNPTINVSRAVALNSARSAIIDSYLSEIHAEGFDTQAIAGWNGPGPYKIVNNYLEGAGENLMFGGATGYIPGVIPSDIEIKQNYFFKPLSWRIGDPSYAGHHWSVKNILELKSAQRVLLDGNVFENNWVDSQSGYAVLFTVRTDGQAMTWNVVQDVTMTNNLIRNTYSAVNILGFDDNSKAGHTRRLVIQNNVFERLDPDGIGFQLLEGAQDILVNHNTMMYEGGRSTMVFDGAPADRVVFTNNIVQYGQYGVIGSGKGAGKVAIGYYAPSNLFANNVFVGNAAAQPLYPECNYFVDSSNAVGFVSLTGTSNYQLKTNSKFRNAAIDHKDVGADAAAVAQASRIAIAGK